MGDFIQDGFPHQPGRDPGSEAPTHSSPGSPQGSVYMEDGFSVFTRRKYPDSDHFVGTINRVGIEGDLGPNDYYGQSYFCTPRGKFVGEVGDAYEEELLVRDLDLDLIREVRDVWQFYRDRRPDAYDEIHR